MQLNLVGLVRPNFSCKRFPAPVSLDTAMKIGGTILSAILGKRVSISGRGAMTGASRTWKESRDVSRAEEKVDDYQAELDELESDCEEEVEKLKAAMDPALEKL